MFLFGLFWTHGKTKPKGNHLLQLSGVLYYSLTRFVCQF